MKDTSFLLEFGLRIKNLRVNKGMTQDELAQKAGYTSRSSINKIELGLVDIPQSKIISIAEALNTTPAYLMGWVDNSKNKLEEEKSPPENQEDKGLYIPEKYRDVMVAFSGGTDDLTQEDIDAIVRFIEFTKNNKKK